MYRSQNMVSKRNLEQKNTYCIIPSILSSAKSILCWKKNTGCPQTGWGLNGLGHEEIFWGDSNVLSSQWGLELHTHKHLSILTKYTVDKSYNKRKICKHTEVSLVNELHAEKGVLIYAIYFVDWWVERVVNRWSVIE